MISAKKTDKSSLNSTTTDKAIPKGRTPEMDMKCAKTSQRPSTATTIKAPTKLTLNDKGITKDRVPEKGPKRVEAPQRPSTATKNKMVQNPIEQQPNETKIELKRIPKISFQIITLESSCLPP